MATLYKADGTTREVTPASWKGEFTLHELRALVGGWIEVVRLSDRQLMVVNEDGHRLGLPHNDAGTRLYDEMARANGWPDGAGDRTVVGDVIVATPAEIGD